MSSRVSHIAYLATLLLFSTLARSQLSPGPLSKSHSAIEGINNCTRCHELGQAVTNPKCLSCHTVIERRIQDDQGYHSSSDVKGRNCSGCHSEHNGLEFELVHWPEGASKLSHSKTGWPLTGAHQKLDCRACHKPDFVRAEVWGPASNVNLGSTYLGLSGACLTCHQDEHREQLSNECESCHHTEAWSPAPEFSHANTRYPLTGKHAQVACDRCHALIDAPPFERATLLDKPERVGKFVRFAPLEFASCNRCHTDPHAGKLGPNCQACHTTDGFKEVVKSAFDHSKTRFGLVGRHTTVTCVNCHRSGSMTEPLAHERCEDCHRDAHGGQLLDRADRGACRSCHTVDGFSPAKFAIEDHARTRYPLTGSHLAVPCFACHLPPGQSPDRKPEWTFAMPDLTCGGCHRDVHDKQTDKWSLGAGCAHCHVTDRWSRVTFDHDTTGYKLVGGHAALACSRCHTRDSTTTPVQLRFTGLKQECAACHQDRHGGQFLRTELAETAVQCGRCHTPTNWKQLVFDHNRDSRFALEGAHAKAACARCHRRNPSLPESAAIYRPVAHECTSCHAARTPSSP